MKQVGEKRKRTKEGDRRREKGREIGSKTERMDFSLILFLSPLFFFIPTFFASLLIFHLASLVF